MIDNAPQLDARDDELLRLEAGSERSAQRILTSLWDENENELRKVPWGHVIDLCFHAGYRHGPVPPQRPRQVALFT